MRAGALRHIIAIQSLQSSGVSEYNEPITSWVTLHDGVYAEVMARRGKEHFIAETGQRAAETVYHFRVRQSEVPDIAEGMRILFEGNAYDIRTILPDLVRMQETLIEATRLT
jgi:SPP1 family predicted phage head-tail adaptor